MNHSTGPATPAGKMRSSANSYKHGLTSRLLILTPEEKALYDEHCQGYFDLYKPAGSPEKALVQILADDYWRSLCGRAFENSRLHTTADPEKSLANITLYIARIERSIKNNTQALQAMQEERKQAHRQAPQAQKEAQEKEAAETAVKSVPATIPHTAQAAARQPGPEFVFSPAQTGEPSSSQEDPSATPKPAAKMFKAA